MVPTSAELVFQSLVSKQGPGLRQRQCQTRPQCLHSQRPPRGPVPWVMTQRWRRERRACIQKVTLIVEPWDMMGAASLQRGQWTVDKHNNRPGKKGVLVVTWCTMHPTSKQYHNLQCSCSTHTLSLGPPLDRVPVQALRLHSHRQCSSPRGCTRRTSQPWFAATQSCPVHLREPLKPLRILQRKHG
jgi:hypothetical protein